MIPLNYLAERGYSSRQGIANAGVDGSRQCHNKICVPFRAKQRGNLGEAELPDARCNKPELGKDFA